MAQKILQRLERTHDISTFLYWLALCLFAGAISAPLTIFFAFWYAPAAKDWPFRQVFENLHYAGSLLRITGVTTRSSNDPAHQIVATCIVLGLVLFLVAAATGWVAGVFYGYSRKCVEDENYLKDLIFVYEHFLKDTSTRTYSPSSSSLSNRVAVDLKNTDNIGQITNNINLKTIKLTLVDKLSLLLSLTICAFAFIFWAFAVTGGGSLTSISLYKDVLTWIIKAQFLVAVPLWCLLRAADLILGGPQRRKKRGIQVTATRARKS